MESRDEFLNDSTVELALADYEAGRREAIHDAMLEMHPAEIANLLEALPPAIRKDFWSLLPASSAGQIVSQALWYALVGVALFCIGLAGLVINQTPSKRLRFHCVRNGVHFCCLGFQPIFVI